MSAYAIDGHWGSIGVELGPKGIVFGVIRRTDTTEEILESLRERFDGNDDWREWGVYYPDDVEAVATIAAQDYGGKALRLSPKNDGPRREGVVH